MKDILFKKFKISETEDIFVPNNGKEKLVRRKKKKKDVVLDGQLSKEQSKSLKKYRQGGEGFILWCEDHVHLAVYKENSTVPTWISMSELPDDKNPDTGRSYKDMWEMQKPIVRKALAMENGRFLHRLIVLCWPRGDGKSLLACLIQLWKFYCFPRQQIMLGANSKDQVKFVHYDIMREIIQNSPKLVSIIGRRNIQEKEMRLLDSKKRVISIIRSISSFSGIVSNITGYTFSEIFDMKNPKFFVQLDGSIRNMPNSFGVIDSTVSEKSHILYKLYRSSIEERKEGEKNLTYFSYRCSPSGSSADFFNPQMTQSQLDDYRRKFPPAEFARYFRNLWDTGITKLFTPHGLEAMHYVGFRGKMVYGGDTIQKILMEKNEKKKVLEIPEEERRFEVNVDQIMAFERTVYSMLVPAKEIYQLDNSEYFCDIANSFDLEKLTDFYDTNWVIGIGTDRADPMKEKAEGARTMVSIVAKGLPGSRSDPRVHTDEDLINKYIYVLLGTVHISDSSLEGIKNEVNRGEMEYNFIDVFCSERWGMFDIAPWLEAKDIEVEIIHPTPAKQKEGFSELHVAVANERFKCAPIGYRGTTKKDIFFEEMEMIETTPGKDWYGSPEKNKTDGIQDDTVFSVVWAIYGLRFKTVDDMQPRTAKSFLGEFIQNKELLGSY